MFCLVSEQLMTADMQHMRQMPLLKERGTERILHLQPYN